MNKLPLLAFALLACGPTIEDNSEILAEQIDDVWVFSYSVAPSFYNDALGGGDAAVVDGCLEQGGAVVIWHQEHLETVEEVLDRLDQGESVWLQVGGGGQSLDEGATTADFPAEVLEHCDPNAVWHSSPDPVTIVDDTGV